MTNRLIYETSSGELSSTDTYKQFIENLRLAEEDCRTLSNLRKMKNDAPTAKAWTLIANNFNKINDIVSVLATHRANSSVGYEYKVIEGNG